jgi:hypothetical protein
MGKNPLIRLSENLLKYSWRTSIWLYESIYENTSSLMGTIKEEPKLKPTTNNFLNGNTYYKNLSR